MKTRWGTLDPFFESGAALGRKVANHAFLAALLKKDPFDAYHFFLPTPNLCAGQKKTLADMFPDLAAQGKFKILTRMDLPGALAKNTYQAFHLSDCILAQAHLARVRNALAANIFPVTGVTHSLSYANFGQQFLKHLFAGCTRRDAVVATSTAGCGVVRNFYAWLRQGYGLSEETHPGPRVERIPLGVDPGAFAPADDGEKAAAKRELGFAGDVPVFLVFARISHSSKMDALPLFRALQRLMAEGLDPRSLTLVMAGWLDKEDEPFAATLTRLAANLGLDLHVITRPPEEKKRRIYQAADVFVSLSDNVQETFGLTILEAMAAGLPVIASDFDGYRDLVVPGETGALVPTIGPCDTAFEDMLAPLNYDSRQHMLLAQETVVDVAAVAAAFREALAAPERFREMGRKGRRRVETCFSWEGVVERWLDLWTRLAAEPVPDREGLRTARHPVDIPYSRIFQGYPSEILADDMEVVWSRTGRAVYRGQEFPTIHQGLEFLLSGEAVKTLVFLARKPVSVGALAGRFAGTGLEAFPGLARYVVLWSLKHDLLERVRPESHVPA